MTDGDRAMLLAGMADRLDRAAARFGSTELDLWQALKALGASSVMELVCLRPLGFPCLRRDGAWYLDCRDFRRWATGPAFRAPAVPKQVAGPQPGSLF